jgi:hypothetical protein
MALSVTCPACGKSFQLAQEIYERKVAGKIVSIRCKQCQSGIRIDATQPGGLKVIGSTPAAETGQGVRARQPTLIGMMGPGGTVSTASGDENALWAVDSGGAGEDRELDDATIMREIAAGTLAPTTLVWRDGMSDWLEVQQVPQLAQHLPGAKKPEPAKVAAPLPAARPKQPSAPEVAVAAPARAEAATPAAPRAKLPSAPEVAPAPPPVQTKSATAPIEAKPAVAAAPAGPAAAPAAKAAARGGLADVPVMHDEDDEDDATMIFRAAAGPASKQALIDSLQEKTPVPGAPAPAAGRPAAVAPVAAAASPPLTAGRPAAAPAPSAAKPATGTALGAKPGIAGRAAGSSPLAAAPAAAPRAAGSSPLAAAPAAAPRAAGSAPLAAAPRATGSSPLAAAPLAAAPPAAAPPAAPLPAVPAAAAPPPPPPIPAPAVAAAAAPVPAPSPVAAPPPPPAFPAPGAPPPPRAKQASAPVLPRGLTPPPERTPLPSATASPSAPPTQEPAPLPPSPPPPPGEGASFPTAPAAPAPMRARQPSAPGFPKGLYPPPERPAPPPPSPPPAPPSGAPAFAPTQNPFGSGAQGSPGQLGQLAPNPFAVATTTDLEFTPARSKTPFIIGGIVLVLAAAGIAVAVTGSGSHPTPPPVPTAPPPTPAAEALTTPPAPTAAPEETAAPEAPAPTTKPQDNIAGTPHPSASSSDFSQMFAAGAQQAQKGTPSTTKAFDAEAARSAVAAVLKSVAACKEPGGPTGQSAAAITFDPSGHVSSVTVGAPFSGTSTGTCIIGAFKGAKVAPFSGLPGTVSQPVSLL